VLLKEGWKILLYAGIACTPRRQRALADVTELRGPVITFPSIFPFIVISSILPSSGTDHTTVT